jgi:hypothetical protein
MAEGGEKFLVMLHAMPDVLANAARKNLRAWSRVGGGVHFAEQVEGLVEETPVEL